MYISICVNPADQTFSVLQSRTERNKLPPFVFGASPSNSRALRTTFIDMKALHEQILEGNAGRVLEAITNAEALLGRQDIDFPRIAVFGDESTGKSSMLEAICKIPFPRGHQSVTRCPTLLRMQRKPGASWSASAWAGYDSAKRKNETHVRKPEDVAAVISELQSKLLNDELMFSTEPVTVSLSSDDAVDLILVDLPGYFTHEGLDGATNSGDVNRVKESLLTYLRDENTIVLVVVPANQLVKTVNIFNILKEYEEDLSVAERVKLHARTIYCFTKVSQRIRSVIPMLSDLA